MQVSTSIAPDAEATAERWPDFARQGLSGLCDLRGEIVELQETLADIEAIGGEAVARKTRRMTAELDAFEPAVTFIGQIKSGKTTLVNALAGRPGLLPADVNPWTSVVTSLHLNAPRAEDAPAATFQFFDAGEWDHLVENGGRIGELSARAGADTEHEKLRAQIAEMREKTRERLGRKFELLLGQTHEYKSLDDELVQRYVCLGDDFQTASARDRQGQFADITKSADLYLAAPYLPVALTLRDTPGMNDTFMMREQITIRALRDSRICVVVLSAHQALNAVDMGLIRLISNVKSRQIVIFVNRIDELADPAAQIPEIRESLTRTLSDHDGPQDAELIFGSALWANAALTRGLQDLPPASMTALSRWSDCASPNGIDAMDPEAAAWALSGVPALFEALGARIAEGAGAKALASVRRRAANIVSGLRMSSSIVTLNANGTELRKMAEEDVATLLRGIETEARARLDASLDATFGAFSERVDKAHGSFIARALDALLQHLERNGDNEVWSYSPDGLRMLMRSAYTVMRTRFRKDTAAVYAETAKRLTDAYGRIFDVTCQNFSVEPPAAPDVPPPVTLAQTVVLDVKTSWWKSWWFKRSGYRSYVDGFRDLIEAESAHIVNAIKIDQVAEIRASAHAALNDFLQEQFDVLADIFDKSRIELEDLHNLFGVTSQDEREALFDMIFEELDLDNELLGEAA